MGGARQHWAGAGALSRSASGCLQADRGTIRSKLYALVQLYTTAVAYACMRVHAGVFVFRILPWRTRAAAARPVHGERAW